MNTGLRLISCDRQMVRSMAKRKMSVIALMINVHRRYVKSGTMMLVNGRKAVRIISGDYSIYTTPSPNQCQRSVKKNKKHML